MEYNIPQLILERLREERAKSPSKKRKVACVIYCQQKDIICAGHNQRITESLTLSQPNFIKQWYAETKKRATSYDKEDFVHAETMACYNSYRRKLGVEDYHYIRNIKKAVKVYVTHKPCEVCEKYLNEFFNEPIIKVVDLDKKKAFIKHDDDKTQYQHLSPKFIEEMAEITTQGAKKYGGGNYLKGDEQALMRLYDALMRHLQAWRMGEEVDTESGKSHLSHVGCNAMMIYALEHKLKLTGEKA
jgi:deoxycytidylate deaminase